jgi:hypothetical protein
MDGGVATVRGGAYTEGGGSQIRGSFAHGFSALDGRLNGIASVQIEQVNPIWGYQRDLTKKMYTDGYSAPVASRDYLVYGYKNILTQGFNNYGYGFGRCQLRQRVQPVRRHGRPAVPQHLDGRLLLRLV